MATHLAGEVTTLARCIHMTLPNNGYAIKTFTDHDQDLVIAGETYEALYGFNASDVASGSDLNADNLEIIGAITTPSITEADLLAGRWDFAVFRIFYVNWQALADGTVHMRSGKLGEVKLDRGKFVAELRGLMQHYETSLGRLEKPACDANLGDARCKADLSALTVMGVVTAMSTDGLTLYDVGRNEPGPTGGQPITGITNANPGVITVDNDFIEGEAVTIFGVVGPALLNTITTVRNPTPTSFELGIDTSDTTDYPAYVSGGRVAPYGGDSGYFDFGTITMVSGASAGVTRDIKGYVPGQLTLHEPFPAAVAVGDIYSVAPGCDKSLQTCRDRFNNVINFRGFPYLPGTDKIIQVGRHDTGDSSTSTPASGSSGGGGGGSGGTTGGSTGGGGGSGSGGGGIGTGGGTNGGGTVDPGGGGVVADGDTLQNVDALFLNLPPVGPHGYPSAFYVAAAGAIDDMLSGYAIYKSFDAGATFPNYVTFGSQQVATIGTTADALGDGVFGDALDTTNTVTVVIGNGGGTLTSDSSAHSYTNYKNLILIGNELVQFRTATPSGGGTYVLSDLYRGCYGTEYAMTGHGIGEDVVFVNAYNDAYTITADGILYNGLMEVWDPLAPIGTPNYDDIGNEYVYKVVGAGKHLADASPITFTNTGESMRPFCPYAIQGSRAGSDLTISWQQRFWINGGWATSLAGTIPNGWNTTFQTTHTVKIYADATYAVVKRTLTATGNTNSVVYTSAQQVTDFGSTQATVYAQVTETWTYSPGSGPLPFESHPARRVL